MSVEHPEPQNLFQWTFSLVLEISGLSILKAQSQYRCFVLNMSLENPELFSMDDSGWPSGGLVVVTSGVLLHSCVNVMRCAIHGGERFKYRNTLGREKVYNNPI